MRFSPAPARAHFSSTQYPPRRPQLGHHTTTYDDERRPDSGNRPRAVVEQHNRDVETSHQPSFTPQTRAPRPTSARGARDAEWDRRADADYRPAPTATYRDADPRPHNPRRRSRSLERPFRPASSYRQIPSDSPRRPDQRLTDPPPRVRRPNPRDRFLDHEAVRTTQGLDTAFPHPRSRAVFEAAHPPSRLPRSRHGRPSRNPSPAVLATRSERLRFECSPYTTDRRPYITKSPPRLAHAEVSFLHQERLPARRTELLVKRSSRPTSPPPSAPPDLDFSRNPNLEPLRQRLSSQFTASESSRSNWHRPPFQERWTSPHLHDEQRPIQDSLIRNRRTPDTRAGYNTHRTAPQQSPFPGHLAHEVRELFPSTTSDTRKSTESRQRLSEAATGANSVEVNMSARGNFRGAHGGQYPPRGHFNQGPSDSRNFAHSASGSSFQGSPSAQSPYSSGRGNWAGPQQSSPQNQFSPQFPSNGYAPTGPAAHLQGSSANAPPIGTPTGPSAQFASGRGYRGSSGGYRGNGAGGRGGARGGFKSGHWGSGNGSRAASSQPDDISSGRATPHAVSNAGDSTSSHGDARTYDADNPFRPPKELQVEDINNDGDSNAKPMPPPTSRAPPTGPAAEKKISFALKLAPKVPVATPKLEISAKFSAPAKKDPTKEPSRHDSRDIRDHRDTRDSRDRRNSRDGKSSRDSRDHASSRHPADLRDLPRNVPTEPRAAKAAGQRQQRQEHRPDSGPEQPREQAPREPRVRMVKKKMKRLKTRPTLPDDLIGSDSVYFRKPGNESVIGAGTYGKVFKALHVYTKNLVALKRIRMEGERDGFPVTAVREIKLLQSLRHINIVALLEVMVEKNECYMVFEYMSHDLTGLLNHPTFSLNAAHRKHLSKQLFEGLDYLHKRGVLHRDIKAANILVSNDGILKLADFGLARFYAKRHQLDYTNRVITIWYRSPELLLGETQYGPAVDIWSAACVMIEIFTRRAIFPGDGGEISQLDKIYAVLGTPHRSDWPGLIDMPWFELLRPGARKPNVFEEQYKDRLPPAAFELMLEMFHYDPAKRPSAEQVLEHAYFTTEAPAPRQVVELQEIEGDWHEFESKALRRENERKDREARKAAEKSAAAASGKDSKKRPPESSDAHREAKRQHVEMESSPKP